jgi:4-hydroxy-tetrahydrodipicolinate synthase
VARLAELKNVIGIKEACGSLEQITDVIRFTPDDFIVLSGDDFTSMPTIFVGGHGVISVVSNLNPGAMARMMEAALKGDIATAQQIHYRLFPLMKLMFKNPSPAPAKKALELMGKIKDCSPRLPITQTDEETTGLLKETLASLEML